MKVLRTASLWSNFSGSYKKKECSALCQNKFLVLPLKEYSGISLSYSITHQSHYRTTEYNSQTHYEICVETIYIFPNKSIKSLRIQPPNTQHVIMFLKNRKTFKGSKALTGSIQTSLAIYTSFFSFFALFKMLYDIPTTFLIKSSKHDSRKYFSPSHPSVAFHIETSHLIYNCKWVNST